MPNFTEKAIKQAFWKLLAERPINKISVKDIVEECGVNRNSFYYHFRDIPSLTEEIVIEVADALIEKYPSIASIDEAVEVAFNFLVANKRAVIHICNSINRSIYEQYLMRICEYVIKTYLDTAFAEENISPEDKKTAVVLLKCELFGLSIDWINDGMPDDGIEQLKKIISACDGLADTMLKRSVKE